VLWYNYHSLLIVFIKKEAKMLEKILVFLSRFGHGNLKIGIRDYLTDGKTLFFLNTPMSWLKPRKLISVNQLYEFAKKTGRPVKIYTWARDEYGTSDGAGFEKTGLVIKPEATANDLATALEHMKKYVSCFVLMGASGFVDHDPVKI